jgi:CBS domain-containing protein
MARDPVVVEPDDDLSVAAAVLVSKRIHRVPVVEKGRLVGILSSLDIARSLVEDEG